jgi:hypothetical protein
MDRRKVLSLTSTAVLSSLAGCGGKLKSVTRTGPPHFESVELTGPDEISVGDEFYLEVSAKNTGGESGDFTNTLSAGGDGLSIDRNVKIEAIGVEESKSAEIGPYYPAYARDYQFRITDYGASHTVTVSTKTLEGSEEFSIENGPAISVTGSEFYPSFLYRSGDRAELFSPSSGSVLAVLHLSIQNQAEETIRVGADSFGVRNGEVITSISDYSTSLSDLRGPAGEPLKRVEIGPGETTTGWILADVPYEQVQSGLQLTWDRGLYSSEPEASWTFDSYAAPAFEIEDFDFPSEVEIRATATGSVTIRNVGGAAGTFQGIFQHIDYDTQEWEQVETITLEIDAGSEVTWSTEIHGSVVGTSKFRLLPETTSRVVDVVPATRSFGDRFTTPAGAEIRVDLGAMNFSGFASSFDIEYLFDNETVTARDGLQFAFVKVNAKNTSRESLGLPSREAFTALAGGSEYSVYDAREYGWADFASPINGTEYHTGLLADPGESRSGWLVFEVPSEISQNDLTLDCSLDGKTVVNWS